MSTKPDRTGSLKKLSDKDLLARVVKLRGTEREVQQRIVFYLAEVERRKLYLPKGYGSLFEFCTDFLNYSRSSAGRRISAARCIARFPRMAALLRRGECDLTALSAIAGVVTVENAAEIASWLPGKSLREVEAFVARRHPERRLRDQVRQIFVVRTKPAAAARKGTESTPSAGSKTAQLHNSNTYKNNSVSESASRECDDAAAAGDADPRVAAPVVCVVERKFKIQFAVEPEFMEKYKKTVSLLSSQYHAEITFETVFDNLMEYYLDRNDPESRIKKRKQRAERKKKHAARNNGSECREKRTDKQQGSDGIRTGRAGAATPVPRDSKAGGKIRRAGEGTRHIPQAIRDEVFVRDGGRCTFVGDDGVRCDSTRNLEIDHIVPFAKGGSNTPENLRLLCAAHNRLAAERAYGKEHMDGFYGAHERFG